MGNYTLVWRELKGARLHCYLSKVKVSATKVGHMCREEHCRMELDVVRADVLLMVDRDYSGRVGYSWRRGQHTRGLERQGPH